MAKNIVAGVAKNINDISKCAGMLQESLQLIKGIEASRTKEGQKTEEKDENENADDSF